MDKLLLDEFKKRYPEKHSQESTDILMNNVRMSLRLNRTCFIRTDFVCSFKYDSIVDELEKQLKETFEVIFVDSPMFYASKDRVSLDWITQSTIIEMKSFRLSLKYSSIEVFVNKIIQLIKSNFNVDDNDVLYVHPRDLEIYPMINEDNEDTIYFRIRLNSKTIYYK